MRMPSDTQPASDVAIKSAHKRVSVSFPRVRKLIGSIQRLLGTRSSAARFD
jgi:hypothetical protein